MKKFLPCYICVFVTFGISLLFSCSSDIDLPPSPESLFASGDSSSSSVQVWAYCVYETECFPAFSGCLSTGGTLSNTCPYSNSSSSSDGAAVKYAYCVFEASETCMPGPISHCPPGGVLNNECPYLSSSSHTSSSGGSNSSGGGSSSSQNLPPPPSLDADEFLDTRDHQKYKFEVYNGRVWMSENLNYSKGGTIGFCYKTGTAANTLGTPGENLTGCDKPNGRNYTYEIATNGKQTQDKAPGICPEGWHIPNYDEWDMTTGSGKMSTNFYVMSGNYDVDESAWQNRKPPASQGGGFYWFSNAVKNQGIALVQIDGWGTPTTIKFKLAPDSYGGLATADNDYFSVRCIMDNGGKLPCGSSTYDPTAELCSDGVKYPIMCGDKKWDPKLQQCNDNVLTCLPTLPSGYFCFENEVYQTTTVGSQTWMMSNLNGGATYNWATAMNLVSTCNSNNCATSIDNPHQGKCPTGWHIPTKAEITTDAFFNSSSNWWTATQEPGSESIYALDKSSSATYGVSKTSLRPVRCVKDDG